jgi:hypothetical protein
MALLLAGCGEDEPDLTVTLPQFINSSDGSVAVSYPEGWVARTAAGQTLEFASSAETLSAGSETVGAGEVFVRALLIPNAELERYGLTSNDSAARVINVITGIEGGASPVLGETESLLINTKDVAMRQGTLTVGPTTFGAAYAVVRVNGGYGLFTAITPNGELAAFIPSLRAMAGSYTYTPLT